jgi:hypothetical protein
MRRIGAVVAACALVLFPASEAEAKPSPPVEAKPPPSAGEQTPSAAGDVTISYPAEGQTVGAGPLTVTGVVGDPGTTVTVERDGRPPFPATVDRSGNFAAPVGTISTGVHRIVVRAARPDGHRAETRRWFTGRAGTRYVALGDSWSEPGSTDGKCRRETTGWPEQVTLPDGRAAVDLLSCRGFDPPQLGTDTDLVTLTFGGDQVGFAELLKFCATRTRCMDREFVTAAGRPVRLGDWTRMRLALVRDDLDGVFQRIRNRVRPDTMIVAGTYPHLLPVGRRTCAANGVIARDERRWIADRIDDLDDAIVARAPRSGVLVADVRKRFTEHTACDSDGWLTGLTAATPFRLNDKGAERYARVVSAKIGEDRAPGSAYPQDLDRSAGTAARKAVAATRITALAADLQGDRLAFAAGGFAPGRTVTLRLAAEGAGARTLATVTADDQGRASGTATVPADRPAGRIAGVEARGDNPAGGTTLGFTILPTTTAATGAAATPALVPTARSDATLAQTGSPGWLFPAALTGVAMIGLGAGLVTATTRRRPEN